MNAKVGNSARKSGALDASLYTPKSVLELGRIGSCVAEEIAKPRRMRGEDVVPLSGQPRRKPPEHVVAAAQSAFQQTGYTTGRGLLALREAIASRVEENTTISVDPEAQVVITTGAMHAVHVIMTALLSPGDEVIIPSPCFSYGGLIRLARAQPIFVPMRADAEYAWDLDQVEAAIGPRTKLLIVNTPVNPTGRVLSHDELERLADIAQSHNLLIVADESYDRLVYDGRKHESIYSVAAASERTLLVQSATKTFAMGAWRVGWIVAPPSFTTIFANVVEWMMFASNHVAQAAVTAAITGPQDWLQDLAGEFQANRNISVAWLRKIGCLPFVVPQGGPFILPDVSAFGITGDEFAGVLITEFGLRVTGGSYYNSPECIRIVFGGTREAVEETCRRMEVAVAAYKGYRDGRD